MGDYLQHSELDRLAFVRRLEMIDAECAPIYNDISELAATICGTPVALVTLLDLDRQWFVSKVGVEFNEAPRTVSFCTHTIQQQHLLIVTDATQDDRFKDNYLTADPYNVRFYAGVPVEVEGHPVGTVCVFDFVPRQLDESQIAALTILARQLKRSLEDRLAYIRERDDKENLSNLARIYEFARNRFENLFQSLSVACYTTDVNGCVVEINRHAETLFGIKNYELIGNSDLHSLTIESDLKKFKSHRLKALKGKKQNGIELKFRKPDGTELWTICNIQPIFSPQGETLGLVYVYNDIGDRKALETELIAINDSLENLSRTDSLTGIANRRHLNDQLEKLFADHSDPDIGLLLIDVDHFKKYNDEYGHPSGDIVLQAIARILESSVPQACTVGRYGGEEFMVVIPPDHAPDSHTIGEAIRANVQAYPWPTSGLTVSIGASRSTFAQVTRESLISLADVRLYQAKHQGRNRVVGWQEQPETIDCKIAA